MEYIHEGVLLKRITLLILAATGCLTQPRSSSDGSALALLALAGAGAIQSVSCSAYSASAPSGTALADTVTSAPGASGSGFGDSYCAVNGVRGGGNDMGSTDVYSLSSTGSGSILVLSFNGRKITNGSGADFIVFENPFNYNGNSSTRFMEAVVVEVSYDGSNWCGFNPAYGSSSYSNNPAGWSRFGGITNVVYNQGSNNMDASTLFASGGGDAFDLANLATGTTTGANCTSVAANSGCTAGTVSTLQGTGASQGVRYVRLIAASACTNPNAANSNFPTDSGAFGGGPDIDGVIGRYPASLP